jgi:hypothetical protein
MGTSGYFVVDMHGNPLGDFSHVSGGLLTDKGSQLHVIISATEALITQKIQPYCHQ